MSATNRRIVLIWFACVCAWFAVGVAIGWKIGHEDMHSSAWPVEITWRSDGISPGRFSCTGPTTACDEMTCLRWETPWSGEAYWMKLD